jgi:uncharacterized coiled-coil protein SlyX
MALVELVHPQGSHQISVVPLINTCELFRNNPGLIITPYRINSGVSLEDFQDFVTALEDKLIDIKDRNIPGLSHLSEEFGFQALLAKLSAHRRSAGLSDAQTGECRSRFSALEERTGQQERQLAVLHSALFPALRRFEADLARLASELDAVRDAQNSDTAGPAAAAPPPGAPSRPPFTQVPAAAPAPPVPAKPPPATAPAVPAPPGRLESLIVGEYPPLFEEFRAKRFKLLWRGSRDGFTAGEFHRRCDGRANTLTLIADTDGNVFGDFTPVEWQNSSSYKGDGSLRSFLFTLRNPHGVPPRKFALRAERKQYAIRCDSECGPVFGGNCIAVADNCNANTLSYTGCFGHTYDSVSGKIEKEFFTGAVYFTVEEIEVFKIAD